MPSDKKKLEKNDPTLILMANKFRDYITDVWTKTQEDKIEDVEKAAVNLRKCVIFFSTYIKHLLEYSKTVTNMSRSILTLIKMKDMQWDKKLFVKLIATNCLIVAFHNEEETIRESCSVIKEILCEVEMEILDEIVQKYSSFLPILLQKILTVYTNLTQAMILEVIFKLTLNAENKRLAALKKQKFYKRSNPAALKELIKFYGRIDTENVTLSSRAFLMFLNHCIYSKTSIYTCEGCVVKVNDVKFNEGDITYIDFSARAKSISFSIDTMNICGALEDTNINYSKSSETAYFEVTFDEIEIDLSKIAKKEIEVSVNVAKVMYKQDMNVPLQEIDNITKMSFLLIDTKEILEDFTIFYDKLSKVKISEEMTDDDNESFISYQTETSLRSDDDLNFDITLNAESKTDLTADSKLDDLKQNHVETVPIVSEILQEKANAKESSPKVSAFSQLNTNAPKLRQTKITWWQQALKVKNLPNLSKTERKIENSKILSQMSSTTNDSAELVTNFAANEDVDKSSDDETYKYCLLKEQEKSKTAKGKREAKEKREVKAGKKSLPVKNEFAEQVACLVNKIKKTPIDKIKKTPVEKVEKTPAAKKKVSNVKTEKSKAISKKSTTPPKERPTRKSKEKAKLRMTSFNSSKINTDDEDVQFVSFEAPTRGKRKSDILSPMNLAKKMKPNEDHQIEPLDLCVKDVTFDMSVLENNPMLDKFLNDSVAYNRYIKVADLTTRELIEYLKQGSHELALVPSNMFLH